MEDDHKGLIACYEILDQLEGRFDEEIYPEQLKEDFNAPDDREYSVTITAKQWREVSKALSAVQDAELARAAPQPDGFSRAPVVPGLTHSAGATQK